MIDYYANDYGYPDEGYQEIEEVATVSLALSANGSTEMIDPKQISEDRVKEELRTRKRLAYEEWKRTYDKEYEKFVETVAIRKVKVEELERQIEQHKQDEVDYNEEYQELKCQLAALPKGSRDRLSLMKRVNASQTNCANAKRACASAVEEMDKMKAKLQKEKEFVCSAPKPECDENEGDDDGPNVVVSPRSSPPSSSTGGIEIGGSGREALLDMVSPIQVNRKGGGAGEEPRRRSGHIGGSGGGGRGGLLAAIQGRGRGGGSLKSVRNGGSNPGRGGLLAAIQSRGKSERAVTDDADEGEKKPLGRGFQMRVPNRESFEETRSVPQCQHGSDVVPSQDDTATPTPIESSVRDEGDSGKAEEESVVPTISNGSTNGSSSYTQKPTQESVASSTLSNGGEDYSRKPSTNSVSPACVRLA